MSDEAKEPKLRAASKSSLPEAVHVLDTDMFAELYFDLQQAQKLRAEISSKQEDLEELQTKLNASCEAYGLAKGFKIGKLGYEYHGWTTRKTLNSDLLLEQGVSAEQIAKSYKDSKPFISAQFVDFDLL